MPVHHPTVFQVRNLPASSKDSTGIHHAARTSPASSASTMRARLSIMPPPKAAIAASQELTRSRSLRRRLEPRVGLLD